MKYIYIIKGKYPKFITVISYPYKHYRFCNLHRQSINFPSQRFQFVGIDYNIYQNLSSELIFQSSKPISGNSTQFYSESSNKKLPPNLPLGLPDFEINHSIQNFYSDPYGCSGILKEKRKSRDPFNRIPSYISSCPDIKRLLNHCDEIEKNNKEKLMENIDWLHI